MVNLDLVELRSKIDMEGKYVSFEELRTALTVTRVVGDLDINLTEPDKEGECRAKCPKCGKERSFCLNQKTNRFNCFAKGCVLKGGGVIDFFAKLHEIPAKEASHILAYLYGIAPYTEQSVAATPILKPSLSTAQPEKTEDNRPAKSGEVSRAEFDALKNKVERLSMIVWSQLFDEQDAKEIEESLVKVKWLNEPAKAR